jgi:hypothetical protein
MQQASRIVVGAKHTTHPLHRTQMMRWSHACGCVGPLSHDQLTMRAGCCWPAGPSSPARSSQREWSSSAQHSTGQHSTGCAVMAGMPELHKLALPGMLEHNPRVWQHSYACISPPQKKHTLPPPRHQVNPQPPLCTVSDSCCTQPLHNTHCAPGPSCCCCCCCCPPLPTPCPCRHPTQHTLEMPPFPARPPPRPPHQVEPQPPLSVVCSDAAQVCDQLALVVEGDKEVEQHVC